MKKRWARKGRGSMERSKRQQHRIDRVQEETHAACQRARVPRQASACAAPQASPFGTCPRTRRVAPRALYGHRPLGIRAWRARARVTEACSGPVLPPFAVGMPSLVGSAIFLQRSAIHACSTLLINYLTSSAPLPLPCRSSPIATWSQIKFGTKFICRKQFNGEFTIHVRRLCLAARQHSGGRRPAAHGLRGARCARGEPAAASMCQRRAARVCGDGARGSACPSGGAGCGWCRGCFDWQEHTAAPAAVAANAVPATVVVSRHARLPRLSPPSHVSCSRAELATQPVPVARALTPRRFVPGGNPAGSRHRRCWSRCSSKCPCSIRCSPSRR